MRRLSFNLGTRNLTPLSFCPREKSPRWNLNKRLGDHQDQFERFGEEKNLLLVPELEQQIVQPVVSSAYVLSHPELWLNLLKPTGHEMHQQFNIQQFYALPTLYLCVLYLSENKQRLVPLTS